MLVNDLYLLLLFFQPLSQFRILSLQYFVLNENKQNNLIINNKWQWGLHKEWNSLVYCSIYMVILSDLICKHQGSCNHNQILFEWSLRRFLSIERSSSRPCVWGPPRSSLAGPWHSPLSSPLETCRRSTTPASGTEERKTHSHPAYPSMAWAGWCDLDNTHSWF